jgi:uracil-DNA glycosylase
MDLDIEKFVEILATRPAGNRVDNPYRRQACRHNLRCYLQAILSRPGRRVLLVGEALGYRGGKLTGIPFSSEKLLSQAPHPFLRALQGQLILEGETSEATASMVWNTLARRRRIPLFWNAFPFHPHLAASPSSNRAPTAGEIAEGQALLRKLAELYQPQLVAGLGHKGTRCARQAFPGREITQIRHPSYGGKADFQVGMARLLRS